MLARAVYGRPNLLPNASKVFLNALDFTKINFQPAQDIKGKRKEKIEKKKKRPEYTRSAPACAGV